MSKIIEFDKQAKEKLQLGINKLSNAVICTLGPYGRNVIIEKEGELPSTTKDGVTVARSISLEDPIENIGAEIIKQAAIKSANQAGDGTTTTTVLAQHLINEGLHYFDKKYNMVDIKKGIERGVKQVIDYLRNLSEKISSENQIKQIATISANNDQFAGNLIAEAINKVGMDGVVTIEDSKTGETYLEIVEGMQFDRGYKSPYFVTNNSSMQGILENPRILIYDGKIDYAKEILSLLETISQKQESLLIIAEDIDNEALATLIINKMRGNLKVCAVKAPDFGDRRTLVLEDIATLTNGTVISKNKGMVLEKLNPSILQSYLGSCTRVNVTKEVTTIIGGNGTSESIETRALEIKEQLDKASSLFEREKLQERLGKLTSGVAIIHVGGANEIELKEYKDRMEDALFATKAAIEEGILPGGGSALLGAIKSIKIDKKDNQYHEIGKNIVKRSLSKPFYQILVNAGIDNPQKVLIKLENNIQKHPWMGFDLFKEKFIDTKQEGILDPTKVVRVALENASSVAGIILTTEAVVYQKPTGDKKEDNIDNFNL